MEMEESRFSIGVWFLRVCSKWSVEVAMKGMNCRGGRRGASGQIHQSPQHHNNKALLQPQAPKHPITSKPLSAWPLSTHLDFRVAVRGVDDGMVGVVVVHPVGDADAEEGVDDEAEDVVGEAGRMHAAVPNIVANECKLRGEGR